MNTKETLLYLLSILVAGVVHWAWVEKFIPVLFLIQCLLFILGTRLARAHSSRPFLHLCTFLIFSSSIYPPLYEIRSPSLFELELLVWVVLNFLLFKRSSQKQTETKIDSSYSVLLFSFFLSGMAALVYQVVWQRKLAQTLGCDSTSTTLIVSIFMLGLGLGSLIGSRISARLNLRSLLVFSLFELFIGIFGALSLPILTQAGLTLSNGHWITQAFGLFMILLLPTLMMGATLPILIRFFTSNYRLHSSALASLYSVNTLGSALASILTVDVLFRWLGLKATIAAACLMSIAASIIVIVIYFQRVKSLHLNPNTIESNVKTPFRLESKWPVVVSFLLGFYTLSQEIVWMRFLSTASTGLPHVFGHSLGFFLGGMAVGTWYFTVRAKAFKDSIPSWLTLFSSIAFILLMPIVSHIFKISYAGGIVSAYLGIAIQGFLNGSIWVLISEKSGQWMATLPANILGSTLGPLVTGFILFEYVGFEAYTFGIAMAGAMLAVCIQPSNPRLKIGLLIIPLFAVLLLPHTLERAISKKIFKTEEILIVSQNRIGVISSHPEKESDMILGGGALAGFITRSGGSISELPWLNKAAFIAMLSPTPHRVLHIGVATGSYAILLLGTPGVEKIDLVELDPGYLKLWKEFDQEKYLLNNPKVSLAFTDARKWLHTAHCEPYDIIFVHGPHHWRSLSSNLLSIEFFESLKKCLSTNGVLYLTHTESLDVVKTAAQVFPYISTYGAQVIASQSSLELEAQATRNDRLKNVKFKDHFLFSNGDLSSLKIYNELIGHDWKNQHDTWQGRSDLSVITDDNLLTEFKKPHSVWSKFYSF